MTEPVVAVEDDDLSGWMEKRGAVNTGWKKRWFDLKDDALVYRKKPGDPAPKGIVRLPGASITQLNPEEGDWQYRITIATTTGRTYVLRAKLAEVKRWLPILQQRASAKPLSAPSPASLKRKETAGSFSTNPLSAITMEEAIALSKSKGRKARKYGFLEKKGEQRKRWRWRWFELRESRLDYYRHPGDNSPRGSVALRDADVSIEYNVQDSSTTQKGFIFLDITPIVSQRIYRMRGEAGTVNDWAGVLKERVTELSKEKSSSAVLVSGGVGIDREDDLRRMSLADSDDDDDEDDGMLIQAGVLVEQKQMQMLKHSMNEDKLKQRDAAVATVEGDVKMINEMMTDIAGLVSDQGRQLDSIEEAMSMTADNVSDGVAQLTKANRR